jgi:DNA (cytosine-5)-methyltransferase 1
MADERWIWDDVFTAVRVLRPRIVLLENVAGHLSMGFGRVLGDLASAGFDAEWGCFRASDVGAPHRRERVFVAAWPAADADNGRRGTILGDLLSGQPDAGRGAAADASRVGHGHAGSAGVGGVPAAAVAGGAGADGIALLPTPRVAATRTGRSAILGSASSPSLDQALELARGEVPRELRALDEAPPSWRLLPTPRATDGTKGGPNQRGSSGDLMLPSAVVQLLPTPTAVRYGNNQSASDGAAVRPSLDSPAGMDRWGAYAAAIQRWEHVTGRPAPDPTEPGTKGQPRLAPAYVEWLMGLPAGWVTDHLPRNAALKCLGNGVVPAQAAHAYTELLGAVA